MLGIGLLIALPIFSVEEMWKSAAIVFGFLLLIIANGLLMRTARFKKFMLDYYAAEFQIDSEVAQMA